MKVATFALIIVFAFAMCAVAVNPYHARPEKVDEVNDPGKPDGREGGEDIATAWPIMYLPFTDTGNTCDNIDNYDEVCPYTGSTSPDVVYSFTPAEDMCISVSLCNSWYDTKVYIYEDGWTPGTFVECNDDNFDCVNPPVSYTSWIPEAMVYAGHTYYIVVDGYYGACGDYVIEVTQVDCTPPCDVICYGTPEGEGPCYDGYVDNYNGGCNSYPYVYNVVPVGSPQTYCGMSGNYDNNYYRDTDWYLMWPCGGVPITVSVEAEFPVVLGFVDMTPGCPNITSFYSYVTAGECEPVSMTEYLPMAQFSVFVSTSDWLNIPCDKEYELTIEGYYEHCDPTAVEEQSWSTIKSLYK
jgi:hypothetical protein